MNSNSNIHRKSYASTDSCIDRSAMPGATHTSEKNIFLSNMDLSDDDDFDVSVSNSYQPSKSSSLIQTKRKRKTNDLSNNKTMTLRRGIKGKRGNA